MNFLSITNLIDNFNNLKENFNKENLDSQTEEKNNPFIIIISLILFLIILIIVIALYYWAIACLINFNLPSVVLVLCILFLLTGNPILSILFSYIFNNRPNLM